jgi:hypothetical protein
VSELSKQNRREELLLRDEQLRNADRDIDQEHRKFFQRGERITKIRAGQRAFDEAHLERAGQRLDVLMEFLLQPSAELTDEELEFHIELLEQRDMSACYLASLLRIYAQDGAWYDRSADYLGQCVVKKWEASLVKKTREQKGS